MIVLDKLRKKFKSTVAVDSVSLDIKPGEVVGLLGPNGAGKSTTIKSIVGGVVPTSGSVEVNGLNPIKNRHELSFDIGYMPQHASLYLDLTAIENVVFFAQLNGVKNARKRARELLILLGLEEKLNLKVQGFSGGMKTRVSLACALIHDPQILILDEPTAGLDPALKRTLWQMFNDFADKGKMVIISTHLMEEAVLCNHLIVINEGKVVIEGTPAELIKQGKTKVSLGMKECDPSTDSISSDPKALAEYLHQFGLKKKITYAKVTSESLEDILINVTDK
jgi:ABC-2 type transport system ATP-binding protein